MRGGARSGSTRGPARAPASRRPRRPRRTRRGGPGSTRARSSTSSSRAGIAAGVGPGGTASSSATTVTGRHASALPQRRARPASRSRAASTEVAEALHGRADPRRVARAFLDHRRQRDQLEAVELVERPEHRRADHHPAGELGGVRWGGCREVRPRLQERGQPLVGPAAKLVGEGARRGAGHPANFRDRPLPADQRAGSSRRRGTVARSWPLSTSSCRNGRIVAMATIAARGLGKTYGGKPAVVDLSFDVRAGKRDRLPRPERRREVHDDAVDARARQRRRHHDVRREALRRAQSPDAPGRRAAGGQALPPDPQGPQPPPDARSGERHLAGARRRGARPGRSDRGREGQAEGLLDGHGAAARTRRRAARRPAHADPRRAGQRPGPAGHPVDAAVPQGAGRRGSQHLRLQPPALRDGADGRPPRRHRQGPADRDRAGRGVREQRAGERRRRPHSRRRRARPSCWSAQGAQVERTEPGRARGHRPRPRRRSATWPSTTASGCTSSPTGWRRWRRRSSSAPPGPRSSRRPACSPPSPGRTAHLRGCRPPPDRDDSRGSAS